MRPPTWRPPWSRGSCGASEIWCQGFSEPGTGSNLASLACRATRDRRRLAVNGQKVWTSLAQYAQRCVLLTRTGTAESAHRGITALFVDMDSPGITVRPIETMHGARGVLRGLLRRRARAARPRPRRGRQRLVDRHGPPPLRAQHRARGTVRPTCSGGWSSWSAAPRRARSTRPPSARSTELLWAFRARSARRSAGSRPVRRSGPETSIDKVLVATAEQAVFDLVAEGLGTDVALGDDPVEPALARRVPLLACRHDLRRQRRDPAQHHRPPAPRPRGRPLMEAAELELFDDGIRRRRRERRAVRHSMPRSTTSVGTTR